MICVCAQGLPGLVGDAGLPGEDGAEIYGTKGKCPDRYATTGYAFL